jgi:hypothetical protein
VAEVEKVTLTAHIGATLEVGDPFGGANWVKPALTASITFVGRPTDKDLDREWRWLWSSQIEPQFETLLALIKEQARGLPEPRAVDERIRKPAPPVPEGGTYE